MRYSEFRPTAADCHYYLEDREDWVVAPVSRNRDSGALENSNFEVALDRLLGADSGGEAVEKHRFGHWGHGWFEIVLVHPSLAGQVEKIEEALENYGILDEEDLGRRQIEEEDEGWRLWGHRDVVAALAEAFEVSESTRAWLDGGCRAWELYRRFARGTAHDDSGPVFDMGWIGELTRDELAGWIRGRRREEREERAAEDAEVREILSHAAAGDREAAFLAVFDRLGGRGE